MKKTILCEDTYGKLSFEKLIKKLKNTEALRLEIIVKSIKGPFDSKAARAVKAASMNGVVIVVVDAHGSNTREVEDRIKKECGTTDGLRVVVIEKSVEDWIVANECIDPRRENALKYLKYQHRYEKYKLPGYGERIDPEKLAQK